MKKAILLDANVIIRFLLNDHPKLSPQAKKIFSKAENGLVNLYFDEVVIAEVIWTFSSFYKIKKAEIVDKIRALLAQNWVVNPRKGLILEALALFSEHRLDYIDCWILAVRQSVGIPLETFDKELKKLEKK